MAIIFLKINIALVILYGFYMVLAGRDTFFGWRRGLLLGIYALAFLVPFLNVQYYVRQNVTAMRMASDYADVVLPVVNVYAESPAITFADVLMTVYMTGMVILGLRFLVQLMSIVNMACHTKKRKVMGFDVRVMDTDDSPFSFFRWIFVNPEGQTDKQLSEILLHESTHARQLHSLDIVLSELFCVFGWINPFCWLMKREVRINLEYLADESVVAEGNARKAYQYHLLGLAYHKSSMGTEIANNFNVQSLKKRIKMMNRKRTGKLFRSKYLLFAPVVAALLLVSNVETVARSISKYVPEVKNVVEKTASSKILPPITEPLAKPVATIEKSQEPVDTAVYDIVEKMPQYPGGETEMFKYLSENIRYPESACKNNISGRVIVNFVVSRDGSVVNPKVVRSVDPALDAEALRVIGQMVKWTPGSRNGKVVNVRYTLPLNFSLTAAHEDNSK